MPGTVTFASLTLALIGCGPSGSHTGESGKVDSLADSGVDADGDGWSAPDDCDDANAVVHPEADERCNGVDDDCDGDVDEDATDASTWHLDADGDGFGGDSTVEYCSAPASYVDNGNDCDDADPTVSPDATELCSTPADDDCDGSVNEPDAADAVTWYMDTDLDGYGADEAVACDAPAGSTLSSGDCDDTDGGVHPLAREVCATLIDTNCDGVLLSCPRVGDIAIPDADISILGKSDRDNFGDYVATSADFDDDGRADVVVAAVSEGITFSGEIYGIAGPLVTGGSIGDLATWTVFGTDRYPALAAAEVADITGDGSADLVIAPDVFAGTIRIVEGPIPAGSHDAEALDGYEITEGGTTLAAPAIALSDVDGDGTVDLLLGAWTDADQRGTVYVLLGPMVTDTDTSDADVTIVPTGSDGAFGASVLGMDVDGDGENDLVVGAPTWDGVDGPGALMIYPRAGLGQVLPTPSAQIVGVSSGGVFGYELSTGDVDASGRDDLYVSAINGGSGFDRPGAGYLFYDISSSGTTSASDADVAVDGVESGAFFGAGGIVGDLNGDGRDDLAIGAEGEADAGAVHIFYGPVSPDNTVATQADATIQATPDIGYGLGSKDHAIRRTGDLTGDGTDDLAIGAPMDNQASAGAGALFIFAGAN